MLEILAAHPARAVADRGRRQAGLTRAGARRLLLTLVATGYATQDGRRFILSPAPHSRSPATGSLVPRFWSFAEPFMREVSRTLGGILLRRHPVGT